MEAAGCLPSRLLTVTMLLFRLVGEVLTSLLDAGLHSRPLVSSIFARSRNPLKKTAFSQASANHIHHQAQVLHFDGRQGQSNQSHRPAPRTPGAPPRPPQHETSLNLLRSSSHLESALSVSLSVWITQQRRGSAARYSSCLGERLNKQTWLSQSKHSE